jgi:diaminopimelate epimerase
MLLHFYKYQGTGNDFVIIDDRNGLFPASRDLVARLCDRRFGIGADGLMLLQNHPTLDFRMVYFNADGNPSSMCGNGGRCLVRFAHSLGVFQQETAFEAVDGKHEAYIQNRLVYLRMNDVRYVQREAEFDFLNTGSPHYVTFVPGVEQMTHQQVVEQGRAIRYNDHFGPKGGTNVNFAELLPDNSIFVRTYERGVEDETYSCGTGVTACALAANYRNAASPVKIHTRGGELQVSFRQVNEHEFTDIYLIGPAEKVFEGTVNV